MQQPTSNRSVLHSTPHSTRKTPGIKAGQLPELVEQVLYLLELPGGGRILRTLARYARQTRLATRPEDLETLLAVSAALALTERQRTERKN